MEITPFVEPVRYGVALEERVQEAIQAANRLYEDTVAKAPAVSAIPALTAAGRLPEGLHVDSYPDFVQRFGNNQHRRLLLYGATAGMQAYRDLGLSHVPVGGSFLQNIARPRDIDIAWPRNMNWFYSGLSSVKSTTEMLGVHFTHGAEPLRIAKKIRTMLREDLKIGLLGIKTDTIPANPQLDQLSPDWYYRVTTGLTDAIGALAQRAAKSGDLRAADRTFSRWIARSEDELGPQRGARNLERSEARELAHRYGEYSAYLSETGRTELAAPVLEKQTALTDWLEAQYAADRKKAGLE